MILRQITLTICTALLFSTLFGSSPESLQRIPHLLASLSESIDPSMREAFSQSTASLLVLLKRCDPQKRHHILTSLEQTLSTSQRILKRQPRSLGPSRRFCDSLLELHQAAMRAANPSNVQKKRFWNSTPPYPAYPQTYYSYTEPLKLLIPFILVALILIARNKVCEWKLEGTDHADLHRAWAQDAVTFAKTKLTPLVEMLLSRAQGSGERK